MDKVLTVLEAKLQECLDMETEGKGLIFYNHVKATIETLEFAIKLIKDEQPS